MPKLTWPRKRSVKIYSPLAIQILDYHKEVHKESHRITVERALQDYMSRMVDKNEILKRWDKYIEENKKESNI